MELNDSIECHICHRATTYRQALEFWWSSNQGVFTCPECMKSIRGPQWDRVLGAFDALKAMCKAK